MNDLTIKANMVATQVARCLERAIRETVAVSAQSYDAGLGTTENEKEGRASPAGFTIGIVTALSRVLCDISMLDAYPHDKAESKGNFLEALGQIWDLCREEAIEKQARHKSNEPDEQRRH